MIYFHNILYSQNVTPIEKKTNLGSLFKNRRHKEQKRGGATEN